MQKGLNKTYNYFFGGVLLLIILTTTIQQFIRVQRINSIVNMVKLIGPFFIISYLINDDISPLTALDNNEKRIELNFDDRFKVYFSFLWRFLIYAGIINAFVNIMIFFVKNYSGSFWYQITNAINTLNFTLLTYEVVFTNIINTIFSVIVIYFVGKTIFETVILRVDFKNFELEFDN